MPSKKRDQSEHSAFAPNLDMAKHDNRFADSEIHYGALSDLGDFFGREMPVHRHVGAFQLHYLQTGTVRVYLDDQLWHAEAPAFFLTPPNMAHGFAYAVGSEGHVLTVRQGTALPLMESEFGRDVGIRLQAPLLIELQQEPPTPGAAIIRLLQLLAEEYSRNQSVRALALRQLASLVLIEVLRLAPKPPATIPIRREDVRIYSAFSAILDARWRDHWRIGQYAGALGVTEGRLNDICQRMADLSPKKIISERLLRESKQSIVHSNAQINEIAYSLGFKDPAYFCRIFTQAVGSSPVKYRNEHRPRGGDTRYP